MDASTMLDRLHEQAVRSGDELAWTRFYQAIATASLFVPLEAAAGETVRVAEIETPAGPTVLAFDRIERLAGHLGVAGDYAEMPGVDLARALAAEGVSMTLNLDIAGSETVLDAGRLTWLVEHFGASVEQAVNTGVQIAPPASASPELIRILGESVGALGRDCPEAWLVDLVDEDEVAELVLVLGLAGDAERMEAEIAEAMTRAGQAATDRRFAIACPGRGSALMAAARREGIGIGG